MHAAKLQRYGLAALVTAFATLLVISGLSYRDWKQYQLVFEQTTNTRRILTLNQSLLGRLRDAETGQRGFLLTARPEYLEPYNAAVERIPIDLNELISFGSEASGQRSRFLQLQSLITDKLAELRQTIDLRRAEGLQAALAVVQTDQGKRTMDRIRNVSRQIETAENERWLAAWNDLQTGAQRSRIITLLGAILLAGLVGGA